MFKRMARGLAAVGRVFPVVLRDLTGLAAAGSIAYGAWLIMPAAGFITGGLLVLVGVVLISAKGGAGTPSA